MEKRFLCGWGLRWWGEPTEAVEAAWAACFNRRGVVEIGILFMPESTEGVDVGQVTALDYENEANRTEKWEKRDEHWVG